MRDVPVLFLDLDDTVRKGKDHLGRFVNTPEDVVIFPEARKMMGRWRETGGRIIGVSNQGGIALGNVRHSDITDVMQETVRQTGNLFDDLIWCPHHPNSEVEGLARCWCRKPGIGMLVIMLEKLRDTYPLELYPLGQMLMVGDRPEDEDCARNAGIRFQWAEDWRELA